MSLAGPICWTLTITAVSGDGPEEKRLRIKMKNPLTNQIGIQYPIIQGPFGGGLSSVELASVVSNAGGLGSFGAHQLCPQEIEELCISLRKQTDRPFAINLWVSDRDASMDTLSVKDFHQRRDLYRDDYERLGADEPEWSDETTMRFEHQAEAILRANPRVFSFVFGIPSRDILSECRKRGIVTIGAATTIEEALALEAAGVDVVLATGCEAGGHRPSFLRAAEDSLQGTLALVPAVRDAVSIPVVAGGGIADGRGVRAALALGADAVQIGTAFLACEESGAPAIHKRELLRNRDGNTTLSRVYTGRLARFLPNGFIERHGDPAEPVLPFPAQSWLVGPIRRAAAAAGDTDSASLYAGQGVPLLHHTSAKDLMNDLVKVFEKRGYEALP